MYNLKKKTENETLNPYMFFALLFLEDLAGQAGRKRNLLRNSIVSSLYFATRHDGGWAYRFFSFLSAVEVRVYEVQGIVRHSAGK